jgi:F0F1-type ATP synthase epsilon subunit
MSQNTSSSTSSDTSLTLNIFSESESCSIKILWVEIDSPTGFFTVGFDHIATISTLRINGRITYTTLEGATTSMTIPGGIATIQHNTIKLLLYKPLSAY